MKKVIAIIVLMMLATTLVGQPRPYIEDKDLPIWAPGQPDLRQQLVIVFNAAIELYNIKQLPYNITSARCDDDGWVFVTVERGTLRQEIKIGQFESLQSVSLKNGYLVASYSLTKSGFSFDWGSGAVGFVLGILVTGAIIKAAN